jgi:hypothetical protein
VVSVARQTPTRTDLDIRPAAGLPGIAGRSLTGTLTEFTADLTGRILLAGIDARLPSITRQEELSWRFVRGIPSSVQLGFIAAVLLGLPGLPAARRWWQALWPPEEKTEYGTALGWRAAQTARWLAFGLLFLPLAGVPGVLAGMAQRLRAIRRAPGRQETGTYGPGQRPFTPSSGGG